MAGNPYDEIVAEMDPEPAAEPAVADPAADPAPAMDVAPEPADPDANPYDEIVADQGAEDEAIRRVHAEGTAKIDRKAEVLRLAERTGHDPGLVDRNFDKLTASLAAADFDMERWRRETPASLVAMFRDRPALGAVARGDEKISPVLRLLRAGSALRSGAKEGLDALPLNLRASPLAPIATLAGAGEAVASGAVAEAFAVHEVPLLTDARTEEGRAAGVLGRVRMTFEDKLAGDEVAMLNTAKMFAGMRGEDTSDLDAQIADRNAVAGTRDYGQGEVEQLLLDAADTAGSLYAQAQGAGAGAAVAGAVVGLGTLVVTKNPALARAAAMEALTYGAKAGSTVASFSLETGGMYGEMPYYTDEGEPIPEEIRAGASILYGITSSAIEGMSFGAAEKAAGPLGKAILTGSGRAEILKQMKNREFRALAKQVGNAFAEHGAIDAGEEYFQEWDGGLTNYYARVRAAGKDQILDKAAIEARAVDVTGKALGGSLTLGVLGAAASTSTNAVWALRLRQDGSARSAEQAAAIVSLAGGPMAKASPGSVAELVARESAASGEAVTSFWVAPEQLQRFFQDGKADPSILGPNGAAQLQEALATGGKVEVPVAVYLDGIAKVEGAEALTEHLATRPGYMTGAELAAAQEGLEEEAQALAKQIEAEDTAPASEAEARLVAGIEEQIRAAGRPAGEAKKAAAFYRAFARTQAARFNMDADALFDGYSLRIERGGTTPTSAAQKQGANPAASRALADLFHKQDPTAREQAMFIDTTTGALNARAWKRIEKSAKSAAVISIEGVKFRNDKAGHEAGNDVFRAAAQALARLRPDVAKVGGDFAIADLDPKALADLLDEANKDPALQGFRLVGAAGKDRLAAMAENNRTKAEAETKGTRAKRGFKPLAALGDPTAGKVAGTPISEALRAALGEIENPGEVFSEIYTEAETGLLTKDGFDAIRADGKAKAFTASLDLNGLKEFNTVLGEKVGDALIERFGNALRELGGADFDAAHISGDEYMAQSDDEAALDAFVERARAAVEDARIEFNLKPEQVAIYNAAAAKMGHPPLASGQGEIVGLLFGAGVGKNVDEAEGALNADKDRLEREGRRGDGAAIRRVVGGAPRGDEGSGVRGGGGRARALGRRADLAEVGRQRYLAPEALEQGGMPQTETPEFREWFGDSKVVDAEGKPLRVFHGTLRDFDEFDPAERGTNTGATGAERAFFFAGDKNDTALYISKAKEAAYERGDDPAEGRVVEVFVRAKNPLILGLDDEESTLRGDELAALIDNDPGAIEYAQENGYDAVIWPYGNMNNSGYTVAVFEPEQIKSATGNRGTFDPNDPNILRQDEPAAQDGATAPRGWMESLGKLTRIFLSKKADASTAIHEGAHFFLNMQGDLAARPDAPRQIRDDRAATLRFLGIEEGKVPREAHEKFARAVEAYVREGKAPSVELAGVFAAFRRFLLKVYESVAGLNVELSDEIREVFDRMLATDAEIARAKNAAGQGRGLTQEQMGVPAEEFAAYESDRTRAADEAGRAVAVELAKEHKREADAWWRKERKAHEARALWEHRFLPAERAIRLLDGELVVDDGSTVKVAVKPTAAEVAEMIGYASVDAMRAAINAHPAEDVWAAAKASERMKERHPGILEDRKRLKNLIAGQFHNEHTLQHLLRERAALWTRAGGKPPRIETMKRAVEILAERKRVKDLKPHARLVAERSQAERKFRAAALGDFATAGDASQKQILNLLGWRAERDLAERLEKAEAAIGKRDTDSYRAGLGRAAPAFLALHDGILAATGFADENPDADAVGALLEAAELVADEGGFAFDVEALRLLLQKPKPWKELTTAEAFNVADAIKNIRAFANARNEITLAGEKAKIEEHVAKIKMEAAALRPDLGKGSAEGAQKGNAKRALERVLGAHGELLDPEIIFESLGPTMGAIFSRYRDAKTEKYALTREVLAPLVKRLESLPKEIADTRFDVILELDQELPLPLDVDLGGPRSRMHLFAVLLNFGNESNRERLLGGYQWTEEQVKAALVKHLPKPWFDLAQEILDLNDKALWPKLAAKEQRKTGLEPGKIGATPIVTPYGTYRGGYFPAKYSKRGSRGDVAERQAEAAAEKIRSSAYVRASTLKSHTKKRADHYENVINLEWSVLPSHVAQVIHDIAFDEMIRDAGRIILHPEVKEVINHRLGERRAAEPLEWLKAVANAQTGSSANRASEVAAVMGAFKSRMVVGAIGLNAATAAGDFANSLVAMGLGTDQGGVSARYGVPAYLAALPGVGSLSGVRAMALSKSPELRNRMEAKHDDHRKMFLSNFGKNRGRLTRAQEAVANTAWFFLEQTERMASTQVWLARYWQEKANGTDEAAAILAADKSVTAVLVSPERVELPALVRDPGSIGSQLVFFGYFAKLYGITVGRLGGAALGAATKAARGGTVGGYAAGGLKVAELAGRAMAVHFFASVVGEVLSGRGPEDEEEPEEYLLRKMLTSPLQMIPIGGGFLEAAVASAVRGHIVAPSARAAPALSLAEGVVRKIGKMVSDEAEDDDRIWAAVQTALLAVKLPANAPVRAGKYLTDLALGDTEAETPFDVASGVMYGERENQPANAASLVSDAIQ